jgi:hypothetical protein
MGKTDHASTALSPAIQRQTHWFTWRHLRCKAEQIPYPQGWTVLRLDIIAARDTPDPVTKTGTLNHAVRPDELADAGGAVAYLTAWITRNARTGTYQKTEFLWRQGDLFGREQPERD